MDPHLCLLKIPSLPLLLLLPCISLFLYRHPPRQGPHQTCQTESIPLLHRKSTPSTQATAHHSRNQDTYQTTYPVRGRRRQLTSIPGDLLPLIAKRMNRAISPMLDRKAQRGFRQARKKLHWRRSGVSCSMKMAIPRKDLANFFVD